MRVRYEGSVRGFKDYGLRELRKAAMRGWNLADPSQARKLQRNLKKAMLRDLHTQILRGPREAA